MEKMHTDPAKGVKRVKEKMFHQLHLISLLCIYDTQMKIALIGETKHISITHYSITVVPNRLTADGGREVHELKRFKTTRSWYPSTWSHCSLTSPSRVLEKSHDEESEPTLANHATLTPAQIADLLNFVLRSTYFQYSGSIYEQLHGGCSRGELWFPRLLQTSTWRYLKDKK